ncbi:MAG TPA: FAD-binding oxidoreductase [Candidatus Acidoferrales bacterium]|nr:FAD-binding oxidoreductase [Candidatus Acidoferrales bacterium]
MADAAKRSPYRKNWGKSPWNIDFHPEPHAVPKQVDYAVIGGGFTGLATAAWLRHLRSDKRVCVFEAERIGAGASGNTGGMVLPESSAGDLPGLGDVLGGFEQTIKELDVDCDLDLRGAWEISRSGGIKNSPISWKDSGTLRVVRELEGGTADPGKLVSGLGRAAQKAGAQIHEGRRIDEIVFENPLRLRCGDKEIRAENVLVATNAQSLELGGIVGRAKPMFTVSVATEPLKPAEVEVLGLDAGKSFYTVDLPYLWGRMLPNGGVLFGSGLVDVNDWRELNEIDIDTGKAAELIARIEQRVRGLDPVLGSIGFTNWWGGPILIAEDWQPLFMHHSKSERVIVLGAYAGQGVALSVYLGRWAAEAMAGERRLPQWG